MKHLPLIISALLLYFPVRECGKLTILLGFIMLIVLQLLRSESNADETRVKIDDFAKEHAARFSRERRKNQELEEQVLDLSTEKVRLRQLFASQNSEIESLKKEIEEKTEDIITLKVELAGFDKKIEAMNQKATLTRQDIPLLQAKLQDIEMQAQREKERSQRISNDLSNYAEITQILKGHFDRTIDALYTEKYDRPWIEKGEMITLSLFSLNLEKGLLALPVGKEIGLEPGAFFSIASLGETICKIKIMESSQNKSVGLIMPLFGQPENYLASEVLTLHIFRILAILGLITLAIMYFMNMKYFHSLDQEVSEAILVEQNASLSSSLIKINQKN